MCWLDTALASTFMLLSTAPLARSLVAAAACTVNGWQTLQHSRANMSRGVTSSSQQQGQISKSVGAAPELLAQLQDKDLLRTCGLIGGKWSEASNGATYDVIHYKS